VDRPLTDFALKADPRKLWNVWTGEHLQPGARMSATLDPHACLLLTIE